MTNKASVRYLKTTLCQYWRVKRSYLHLVTESAELLPEHANLIEFVVFPLADILEPRVLKHSELELTLTAVISVPVCMVCAAQTSRRCGRCRVACYCSTECQLQDWQEHKTHCTLSERSAVTP